MLWYEKPTYIFMCFISPLYIFFGEISVYFFGPLFFFNFILFLNFTILYWFCQISKWIRHRYICVPHPEPSSSLHPPHTIPLGRPSAPAPSIQYPASNLDWRLIPYMIIYVFQCLAHFLIRLFIFLVLSCIKCLYILELNSLSVVSFAVIVFHSEGCLFTLLIVSFVVQKLLSLISSHCLFLLLFPLLWEVGHRGSCCDLCQRVLCLCFPLSVLIVSGVKFRSLIHFEFIFVYGVKKCSSFIFYKWLTRFPSTTC